LTACDSKGKQMVFKKKGDLNIKDEWEKLSDAPLDVDAAWAAVVEEMKGSILKEAGFSGGAVIESAHPYNSGPQKWTKNVGLKGSKGLDVYWGKKTSTLDDYASITIEAGPLTKATAGPGARVIVQTCGGQYNCEHLRGRVGDKGEQGHDTALHPPQGTAWKIELDVEDLRNSSYSGIFGKEEEKDEDNAQVDPEAALKCQRLCMEMEQSATSGRLAAVIKDTLPEAEKKSKEETADSKEKDEEMRYFCTCAVEPKSVQVTYSGDQKISDEIAGFAVDKSSPLMPFTITGFTKAGPAQEAGVKVGWFLDLHELLDNHLDEVQAVEGEEEEIGEVPDSSQDVLADLDKFSKRLDKFRETSDITLTFINGLETKLLPTAVVKYDNGNKVGEEIEQFGKTDSTVLISSFQEEDEEEKEEEGNGGRLYATYQTGPLLLTYGKKPSKAKKKIVNLARDVGVKSNWQLDLANTIKQSGASLKLSEQDILEDPSRLLELTGVTLVFEPSDSGDTSFFRGYGRRGDGGDSDDDNADNDDVGMWQQVHVPQNSCTFNFQSDHDSSNTDQVRWGIFAVVMPTGPEKPTQKAVDDLCLKWASSVSRANGIKPDGIQVEPEDWDEGRLRALCAKYGWEFEWMTVEGERQRRLGRKVTTVKKKNMRPRMQAPDSERPDGWKALSGSKPP